MKKTITFLCLVLLMVGIIPLSAALDVSQTASSPSGAGSTVPVSGPLERSCEPEQLAQKAKSVKEEIKPFKEVVPETTCGYNQGCKKVAEKFPPAHKKCMEDCCKKDNAQATPTMYDSRGNPIEWRGEIDRCRGPHQVEGRPSEDSAKQGASDKCFKSDEAKKHCNKQESEKVNEEGKKEQERVRDTPNQLPQGADMTKEQGQDCANKISGETWRSLQNLQDRQADIKKLTPDQVAEQAAKNPEKFKEMGEKYGDVLKPDQKAEAFANNKNAKALAEYEKGVGNYDPKGKGVDKSMLGNTNEASNLNNQAKGTSGATESKGAGGGSTPSGCVVAITGRALDTCPNPNHKPAGPPKPEDKIGKTNREERCGGLCGEGEGGSPAETGPEGEGGADRTGGRTRGPRGGRPDQQGPGQGQGAGDSTAKEVAQISANGQIEAAAKTAAGQVRSAGIQAMATLGAAVISTVVPLLAKDEGGNAGGQGGTQRSTDSGVTVQTEQMPNGGKLELAPSCVNLKSPTNAQIEACKGLGFQINGGVLEPVKTVTIANQNPASGPNLLVPTGTRGTTEQLINEQGGATVETTFGPAMPGAASRVTGAVTMDRLRVQDVVSEGVVIGDYRTSTIARYPSQATADKPTLLNWFNGATIWSEPEWPVYQFKGLPKATLNYQTQPVDRPGPQTVNIGKIGSFVQIVPNVNDMRIDMKATNSIITTIIKDSVFKGSTLASSTLNLDTSAIRPYLLKAINNGPNYIVSGSSVFAERGKKLIQSSHGVPPSTLSNQQCRLVYGGPCPR